jgi:plastocyanin
MLKGMSIALMLTLAACSDSGSKNPDAAKQIDAAAATVMAVTCPATVPLTVDAPDDMLKYVYTPENAPISVGGIVKFTMHTQHNVLPNPIGSTDSGLKVNFNETKCLMFTKAGTFGFLCGPHQFVGTITVQ